MSQIVETPSESLSPRGNFPLLIGGVIGLVSAVGLAWDGRVGVDVLAVVLLADGTAPIAAIGERLVLIGCCPLGLAIGGTLVALGLHRASQRGLFRMCLSLVLLYGILAAVGSLAVWYGTGHARSVFHIVATTESAVKPSELIPATDSALVWVSRGWLLLACAHIALLAGCVAQIVSRSKSTTESAQRTNAAMVAVILLWLFAVIVSAGWIHFGRTFQQDATTSQIKPAQVAAQISAVLVMGSMGSLLLMLHALLTTVLAAISASGTVRRSSSHSPQKVE